MAIEVTMRHVLLYESADDVYEKAPPHFAATGPARWSSTGAATC